VVDLCEVFWALGDPVRYRIVDALLGSPLNVSQLVTKVGASQPNVSRHLKALRERGVIRSARNGKWVEYSIEEEAFFSIGRWISGFGTESAAFGATEGFRTERPTRDEEVLFGE
jgi:DNA-binding transcriptional ArsR family regulator